MTYRDYPEIAQRYKSKRWQRIRKEKLLLQPFCERCLKQKIYTPAKIVHHITHIDLTNYLDDLVFFNIENLESLCQDCHNKEHFSEEDEFYFDREGNLKKKC